jgi:hypothetical protein
MRLSQPSALRYGVYWFLTAKRLNSNERCRPCAGVQTLAALETSTYSPLTDSVKSFLKRSRMAPACISLPQHKHAREEPDQRHARHLGNRSAACVIQMDVVVYDWVLFPGHREIL